MLWKITKNKRVFWLLSRQNYCTMTAHKSSVCLKLGSIEGHNGKENQVLLCGNPTIKFDSHVIFFGGDVQDYKENMENYLPHKDFVKWNLETTSEIIQSKFPQSLVWVVRPNDLLHSTFSIFSSFLASTFNGAPDQSVEQQGQGSWLHLKDLLYNSVTTGIKQIKTVHDQRVQNSANCDEDTSATGTCDSAQFEINAKDLENKTKELDNTKINNKCDDSNNLDSFSLAMADSNAIKTLIDLPIHIIGFSKGCVVLNQLLYDLNEALSDEKTLSFVKQVKRMTWLDGGHSGGLNTWVTNKSVIEKLKETSIEVEVHVTPYQVKDPMRDWIGKEEKRFVFIMKKLGIPVHSSLHFEELEASLENHFNVLNEFK